MATKLLLFLLVFSAFNTGLIWLVQLVHYPGFMHITGSGYPDYQQFHMKSISYIVAPSMGIELLLSMVYLGVAAKISPWYWVTLGLLLVIWAITIFWAVPLHGALLGGYDAARIQKLVNVNWGRTIAWSVRTIVLTVMVWRAL